MNPKVVQPSTLIIERNQIEQILALRESRKTLKDRLDVIEKALDCAEDVVMGLLDSGAISPPGYQLAIQETSRRYPAWKEHFIDHMGKAEADIVLNETVPTISRKLVLK